MATDYNPFRRMPQASDPESYFGSDEWVQYVLEAASARQPRSLEITSLPYMGKSTLMRYLAHPEGAVVKNREGLLDPFRKEPARLFFLLVKFRHCPQDTKPFEYLYQRFRDDYPEYRKRAEGALGEKLPDLVIDEEEIFDSKSNGSDHITLLGQGIRKLATSSCRIRPVFLLDDFDWAIEKLGLDKGQTERLRPWREHVSFILAAERPIHQVDNEVAGSPFFQMLPLIPLSGLRDDEAIQLLREPPERGNVTFPAGDIELLLQYAGNHPHLLIQAGTALWDIRQQLGILNSEEALPGRYQTLLKAQLMEDFKHPFRLYWDKLNLLEQEILIISSKKGKFTEVQEQALPSLVQYGLMKFDKDKGRWRPFCRLFEEFVCTQGAEKHKLIKPELTGRETALYEYLRKNPDRICTFDELWQKVWKQELDEGNEDDKDIRRPIQVTVSRLRKKLAETTGEDILSIRDQGYRFIPPAS